MKENGDCFPYPVRETENDDFLKYCCPPAAWRDITGLVPYSASDAAEPEANNDVYSYLPENPEQINNQKI